jgi:ribose 5-phosphate isomerase B
MRVALACDHRGFKIKNMLEEFLTQRGYAVIDFGTHSFTPCDYPDYVYPACKAVSTNQVERAIIICYTGIGSCIVANKIKGIRAALVYSLKSALLSRKHNNSNVLVLPAYFLKTNSIKRIVSRWLKTEFEGGRHLRRIKKIEEIEARENV